MKREKYSREFKREAVRLVVDEQMSARQVAEDLGVNSTTVSTWVRLVGQDGEDAFPGKGKLKPQDERIRQLEKENRRLQMERDILKKAITFFGDGER